MYQNFYQGIPGATTSQAFTPPDFNQDQQNAFGMIRGGANRTPEDVMNMVNTYQNPYDHYVIDEINRQSQGPYSLLKQAMSASGGMGSNRQVLGANDIDLSRLNQIGGFKQSQFNNSLQTALGQDQQSIQNLLGIGGQQQNQQWMTQQAPYNALQAQGGLLQPVANYFGQSAPEKTVKTGGGLGGLLGGIGQIASLAGGFPGVGSIGGFFGGSGLNGLSQGVGSLFSSSSMGPYQAFSDRRLKENIKHIGEENGHRIYEFNYIGNPQAYVGVMADEVEKIDPEAVYVVDDGIKAVNYDRIGVKFREA